MTARSSPFSSDQQLVGPGSRKLAKKWRDWHLWFTTGADLGHDLEFADDCG